MRRWSREPRAHDLTDKNNEPCSITAHGQRDSEAYRLAATVWRDVMSAKTYREACKALEGAGCKLHSFCAVD